MTKTTITIKPGGQKLISKNTTLYCLKYPIFNKKNDQTYKETEKYSPYTGKKAISENSLIGPKCWNLDKNLNQVMQVYLMT